MDAKGMEEQLGDFCEKNSPPFDEAVFLTELRRRTGSGGRRPSTSGKRNRLRVALYAGTAVLLIAALTVGGLEAQSRFGAKPPVVAVTDQTAVTATAATTGQTAQTTVTSTLTAVETGKWVAVSLTSEGVKVDSPVSADVQVHSLAIDPSNPNVLYAGTEKGVFKSTNAAKTWKPFLSLDPGRYFVGIDPAVPTTIYVLWGTAAHAPDSPEPVKLMRSDDDGGTWSDLSGTDVVAAARQVFADGAGFGFSGWVFDTSTQPSTAYLGASTKATVTSEATSIWAQYWRSTDKGKDWSLLDEAAQNRLQPLIDSSTPPLSVRLLGGKNLLDAGGHVVGWCRHAAEDPKHPSIVYAGTDTGVCKSTDGGKTWTKASAGLTDQGGTQEGGQLAIDPNAPQTLYVAAWDGVYKSVDGGASWKMILSAGYLGEGNRLCSVALAPSATSTLYAWTSDGLFRSDNGGNKWTALAGKGLVPKDKTPFQGQLALVAADDPDTLFAITGEGNDTYRSTDGGKTWGKVLSHTGSSFDGFTIEADPNNPSTMYADTWVIQGPGRGYEYAVVKSVDKGATWITIVPRKVVSTLDVAVGTGNPARIYTLEYGHPSLVSRSLDGGVSWKMVDIGLSAPIRQLLFDPRSPKTVYALVDQSDDHRVPDLGVFRTVDDGATWSEVSGILPEGSLTLALSPAQDGTLYAYSSSGIYEWVAGK
jgi:hypothetical protein